jgi:hypothetical protein
MMPKFTLILVLRLVYQFKIRVARTLAGQMGSKVLRRLQRELIKLNEKFSAFRNFIKTLLNSQILVEFSGDLGSQLFQYATARTVRRNGNDCVGITGDFSDFSLFKRCIPSLAEVGINVPSTADLPWLKRLSSYRNPLLNVFSFDRWPQRIQEITPKEILAIPPRANLILSGYWRNSRYFESQRDLLRSEVRFFDLPSALENVLKLFQDQPVFICSDQAWVQERDLKDWHARATAVAGTSLAVLHLRGQTKSILPVSIDLSSYSQGVQLHFVSRLHYIFLSPSLVAWWGAWLPQSLRRKIYFPSDWNRLSGEQSDYDVTSWHKY